MRLRHRDDLGAFLNEAGLVGRGAEVGAQGGAFAARVLARWWGTELALVDCWEEQDRADYLDFSNDPTTLTDAFAAASRLAAADPRVRLVRASSPGAADRFPDGSLDFVYVDGNHAYPAVRADLEAWYPKVKPGGLLAGHDYLDGIVGGCLFGVRTAVDRFAAALNLAPAFTTADPPFVSWYFRKPLGPAPAPERVAVLTAFDAGYERAAGELSRANKAAYCARHGYRFVCRTDGFDPSRPPSWSKVPFIRAELPRSEWVFWSDADALVMDPSVRLTRFVQDGVDVVCSGDHPHEGINAGHLFVRNTPWADQFLARVHARTDCLGHPWWEQEAINRLYAEDPEVRRRLAVVPNKLFNGFPYPGAGYERGDFLVHFPGLRGRDLVAAMRSYVAMADEAAGA